MAGLKRKLTTKLAPPIEDYQPDWEVTDILCEWWRPNFDKVMVSPSTLPWSIVGPQRCIR